MLNGYHIVKLIAKQKIHIVEQAEEVASGKRVILKTVTPHMVSAKSIASQNHEYEFLKSIASEYVIAAIDLSKNDDGHYTMVLEDIDGIDLGKFLEVESPIPLELFFEIATSIAKGVRDIHAKNIIHKDINPSNIIFNQNTKIAKIIDFSISTELARESQEINMKGSLEGSLFYLSPEQTGRINRYLDYRTDYYSMGVTFFEMLTGQLPFNASDALGYISSHIAHQPPRVDQLNPAVPKVVADLIDILLAKSADDRYQSSTGLIHDLTLLQGAHKNPELYTNISLRSKDRREQFHLPQKLFGRENAIEKLFNEFDSAAYGRSSILLVRGPSGIGKSSLIQEVYRKFSGNRLFFLKGKFDQFTKDVPFSALIQGFSGALEQIMRMEKEEFQSFATKMKHLLGVNGEVITNFMPEFKSVIGTPPRLAQLNPQEAQVRTTNTLLDFISAFSRPQDPLILFLDDMQWADLATLELLETIYTKASFKNIFLILSYRDNEVSTHHPLALTLDRIAQKNPIETIDLTPLELPHVTKMIAETLEVEGQQVDQLAALINEKTHGNPFFVEEFLKDLWQRKLISFDRIQGCWHWDIEKIRELEGSSNIVDYLLGKLGELDESTKHTLMHAAALGNKFQLSILSLILKMDPLTTIKTLDQAIKAGLIIPLGREYRLLNDTTLWNKDNAKEFDTEFKFQHDRIQQVSYGLIDKDKLENIHLSIARILDQNQNDWAIPVTEISRHYNKCYHLITNDTERLRLIELNLLVATKALESNAYGPAKEHITVASGLHREDDWRDHHDLIFDVYKSAAEIYYYLNQVEEGGRCVEKLVNSCRDNLAKAEILTMQSGHFSALGLSRAGVDTAISALRLCNYYFPRRPNIFYVAGVVAKMFVVASLRNSKQIIAMEKITDRRHGLVLTNLAAITQTAFNLGDLFSYAAATYHGSLMILKHGNSNLSAFFFSTTSAVFMGVFKMRRISHKLALIAIESEKSNDNFYLRSNSATILPIFVYYWHKDHKNFAEHFNNALQMAYQAGNNYYSASAAACNSRYITDQTVQQSFALNEKMIAISGDANSQKTHECCIIVQGLWANLLGMSHYSHSMTFDGYNEVKMRRHVRKTANLTGVGGYTSMKIEILVLCEKWKYAVRIAGRLRFMILGVVATKYEAMYRFYKFLALTQYVKQVSGAKRLWSFLEILYQRWSLSVYFKNNPESFKELESIARAEMAALYNKPTTRVLAEFEKAIAIGKLHSNNMAAVASHRAFLYTSAQHIQRQSEAYFKEAIHYYDLWGAISVSSYLKKKYKVQYGALLQTNDQTEFELKTSIVDGIKNRTITTMSPTSSGDSAAALDIESITKAVRTIFDIHDLEKLTEAILGFMMENAGASRSSLILSDENNNLLTCGVIDNDNKEKNFKTHPIGTQEVPKSLIASTMRTGKVQVIENVASNIDFTRDPYFTESTAKSALAMPISIKGAVVGVAYLQNNHTIHAFTPSHLQVLEILATNAAASIVNTKLQASLEEKVRTQTKAVKAMLENVAQGILMLFGDEIRVHPEYSRYLEEILETKEIANQTFADLVVRGSTLNEDQRSTLLSSISSVMGTPLFAYEVNGHHLTKEIGYVVNNKLKTFELDWSPIVDEDENVEKVLLTIRDVTQIRKMQLEIAKQQKDMASFMEVSNVSHEKIGGLMAEAKTVIESYLEDPESDIEALKKLFMQMHTFKGQSRTFGLVALADSFHQAEQVLANTTKTGVVFHDRIAAALQLLMDELDRYDKAAASQVDRGGQLATNTLKKIEQMITTSLSVKEHHSGELIADICNTIYPDLKELLQDDIPAINDTAKKLGKEPPEIVYIGDGHRYPQQTQNVLKKAFVHLFNNSLDHGLEPAEERKARGKGPVGTITIEYIDDSETPVILFSDDGKGMNLNTIKKIAVSKNLLSADSADSPKAIGELIFKEEFSTKTEVSLISGRGVGMSALKFLLQECGCDIQLQLGEENDIGYRSLCLKLVLSSDMVISKHETRLKIAC